MTKKVKPISEIKNKVKRREEFLKLKSKTNKEKKQVKKKIRNERELHGEEKIPKGQTHTIESLRQYDDTTVDLNDEEAQIINNFDQFSSYFDFSITPQVAITSSFRPNIKTRKFCREFSALVPNSSFFKRKKCDIEKVIPKAIEKGFTDLIMISEDHKVPYGMMICHLPNGPTAYFKILSFKLTADLHKPGEKCTNFPEVVLNNFTTSLGHAVGKIFAVLFPQKPNFKYRRLVTFHNQRDYIFFRHHRYQFKKEGEKVALHELGPRFSLRLQWLQKGPFNPKYGEYEWSLKRHRMESNRRKFYL